MSTMSTYNEWVVLVTVAVVIDLTMAKLIDLSHDHSVDTNMAPQNPPYSRDVIKRGDLVPGVYVEFNSYSLGEHGGTHMDAPNHFVVGGRSLAEVPIEDTIVEGVMVDCSEETANNSLYALTVEKLTDWEKVYGRIPDGAGVIINFNRSSRFTDPKSYYETDNLDDKSTFKFPYISGEAADWMAGQRNVKVLASDTACPDKMFGEYPVHRRFLQDNRLIVENLNDPGLLPPRNFRFHFSPVKFVGGTGVQVRAYAMTYDPQNHGTRIGGWCVSACGLSLVFIISHLYFVY